MNISPLALTLAFRDTVPAEPAKTAILVPAHSESTLPPTHQSEVLLSQLPLPPLPGLASSEGLGSQ